MQKVLKHAIEKFNKGEYFECHDILEDYWYECKPEEKDFIRGLLHYAVAFHHLINKNNPQGAKLQLNKCIKRLKNYNKIYRGIDSSKIINTSKKILKMLESGNLKLNKLPVI